MPVPDAFAARFSSEDELGRRALKALVLEEVRAGRLERDEARTVLGLPDLAAVDARLAPQGRDPDPARSPAAVVAAFKAFAAGKTLGGLDVKALIAEGRR